MAGIQFLLSVYPLQTFYKSDKESLWNLKKGTEKCQFTIEWVPLQSFFYNHSIRTKLCFIEDYKPVYLEKSSGRANKMKLNIWFIMKLIAESSGIQEFILLQIYFYFLYRK